MVRNIKLNQCLHSIYRRQSKTFILSMKQRSKSLETEFTIAICRPTGDKWQSKILFLAIFDPRSSIVRSVFDNRLFGVVYGCQNHKKEKTHFECVTVRNWDAQMVH